MRIELPYYQAIPLLGIYPKNYKTTDIPQERAGNRQMGEGDQLHEDE